MLVNQNMYSGGKSLYYDIYTTTSKSKKLQKKMKI